MPKEMLKEKPKEMPKEMLKEKPKEKKNMQEERGQESEVQSKKEEENAAMVEALKLKLQMMQLEENSIKEKREFDARCIREEREYELKMREIEARKEIELKKIEMEGRSENGTLRGEGDNVYRVSRNEVENRIAIPSIGDDADAEAILNSFERLCRSYEIRREKWILKLVPFLTGKALKAYSRLSEIEAREYDTVKNAILHAFRVTPEEHRLKFRKMCKGKEESYMQFATRMKDSFQSWINGEGVENDCEKIEELMKMEQFFKIMPDHLKIWLHDREPKNLEETAKLADKYVESRDKCWNAKRENNPEWGMERKDYNRRVPLYDKKKYEDHKGITQKELDKCFYCDKIGHIATQCPKKAKRRIKAREEVNRTCYSEMMEERWPKVYERKITVNERNMKAWRDTGADITVVSDKVVKQKDYTGKIIKLKTMVNEVHQIPTANIWIQEGGKTKRVEVAVMERMPIEVILGNDVGEQLYPTQSRKEDTEKEKVEEKEYKYEIYVNDRKIKAIRDTGSNMTLIDPRFVKEEQYTGEVKTLKTVDGWKMKVRVARVKIKDKNGIRKVNIGAVEGLPGDMLWGNDDGPVMQTRSCYMVVTRSREKERERGRKETEVMTKMRNKSEEQEEKCGEDDRRSDHRELIEVLGEVKNREDLIKWQREDEEIENMRKRTLLQKKDDSHDAEFYEENGMFMRKWKSHRQGGKMWVQIVLPKRLRIPMMSMAHDIEVAGHLGIKKTRDRLMKHFYWPGVFREIKEFVQSCQVCQRMRKRKKDVKAPLQPLPIIGEPFFKVGMDLVGPLRTTDRGNRYVLVIIDYATKYPEAIPMTNIESETVVKGLIKTFTRVGFPQEIISDQGKQFVGQIMVGLWKRTGVKVNRTTPYHPQSNGQVENFNGTLKHMLRTLSEEYGEDWDEMLPYALFAYREVPNESTGFSPFELLFGREVRGPMDILKHAWTHTKEEKKNVIRYLNDLRAKMRKAAKIAVSHVEIAQERQKRWYDRKARERQFEVGEKVLILNPKTADTFDVSWSGPYEVVKRIGKLNYEVRINEEEIQGKIYHVNMLKKWRQRKARVYLMVEEEEEEISEDELAYNYENRERQDGTVKISADLEDDKGNQLNRLVEQYKEIFSGSPGRTTREEHSIELNNKERICQRAYVIPFNVKEEIEKQVEEMLKMDIIRISKSEYAAPIVLVPKKDGTKRFCVDYRKLNAVTKTDAYPSPNVEEMLMQIKEYKYLSKIDLTRGYWQIPMKEESKYLTAFRTHHGLFEFNVMPFGLKNSAATFTRLMDQILRRTKENIRCYMDDILIGNGSWQEHLEDVREVLERLKKAGLTAKREKCEFGASKVEFLGHEISKEGIKPQEAKVEAIRRWKRPKTKKQVRAFLGITGYYRKYIKNYADKACPLTELIKKKQNNVVEWDKKCQDAFDMLRQEITSAPILVNPKRGDRIILQTDASDTGIGAVVSVDRENQEERPVAFLSRKLRPAEIGYSTIEKEALAMIYAIERTRPYLYGRKFSIETDHNPLTWMLQMKSKNRRILRWMMLLQDYDFDIRYKKGKLHSNADGLSRCGSDEEAESLYVRSKNTYTQRTKGYEGVMNHSPDKKRDRVQESERQQNDKNIE